jgi:hypothetical protein
MFSWKFPTVIDGRRNDRRGRAGPCPLNIKAIHTGMDGRGRIKGK